MVIQRLTIASSNLDRLASFYGGLLEMEVIKSSKGICIKAGTSTLEIVAANKVTDPFYHFAFNIPSNKIEEAKLWLQSRVDLLWIDDYKSDIAEFVNWHARSVYFFDPAGNIVEFIARFDLDNKSEDSFHSGQILSISEVGLVFPVEDLENRTGELMEKYQLPYFDKQPPLPQFKALGDDEGLFIIVSNHRNWYPTQKPSGIFPMEISFRSGGSEYLLKA